MYVDSTGALLPQETSAAQDAAATAKMIRFIVFIGFTFFPLKGNTHTASPNIREYSSKIFC